ncbi:R3H domain-containing protein 4 isoform X1 [Brienomyrus brachyistius]|uniref:R3H domain-containing protein 4 isoform X1 n=1 Tax=Brienomyrus brachyistius TaxID=42636 RepID=UPI0020B1B516|nr:R3H domain-containing protein 4 isoform X1 [Brienomyrus brachyistius]
MVVLTNATTTSNSNEARDYILVAERSASAPSSPSKRVSPAKKKQFFINQAIRNSDLIPRAKGKKSLQRQENSRYLANLLERDECSKDEADASREPAAPSIFTEACTNSSYIQSWNDFMNRSGDEQDKLLALLEEKAGKSCSERLPKDERELDPAYTAQDCFQRIDRRLRTVLRRRHVPMGMLEVLEEDLLRFFVAHPRSVYTTKLASSYERLLLHAVCQYMDLVSAIPCFPLYFSHNLGINHNGDRQTKVVNKQQEFSPPKLLLSAYLEQMS